MTTKINLIELEQKAKEATPGPWDCGETSDFGFKYIVSNDDAIAPCFCMKQHDASFIASMNPTTALALIRVARAAKSMCFTELVTREFAEARLNDLDDALKEIGE